MKKAWRFDPRAAWSALRTGGAAALVLDVGPQGTRAAVWQRGSSGGAAAWRQQGPAAEHPSCAPDEALPALLAQLRGHGARLPRSALLLHAGIVLTGVDLPVDPDKPRPAVQMLEMVRYESEPALAAHNGLWTVGEVLAARGALSAGQRQRIAQALRQGLVNELGDPKRFGEVGVDSEGLPQPVLDAALAAQHEIQVLDSSIACGWQGRRVRDGHGQRTPLWWLSAGSAALRQRWLDALHRQRLRPLGLWPRAGLAAAHAAGSDSGTTLVLEVWPEQMLALRLVDGQPAGWRQEARQELPADPQVLAEMLAQMLAEWQVEPVSAVRLLVADAECDAPALVQGLQRLLREEVQLPAADPAACAERRAHAALQEAWAAAGGRRVPAVALRDPRPAWWRGPGVRPWLAVAAAGIAGIAWQGWEWHGIRAMRAEQARLQGALAQQSSSAQEAQELTDEAHQLDQQAAALRAELARAIASADSMAAIAERLQHVPALIRALGASMDPRVVLDAVVEGLDRDIRIGLEVRAWSPDQARLLDYANTVREAVRPLGLVAAQPEVKSRPGRLGSPGYEGRFWLVPEAAELQFPPGAPAGAASASPPSPTVATAPRR
ncbi:MAG: hypothetical protein QM750_31870 [Rubrivivax sp.]